MNLIGPVPVGPVLTMPVQIRACQGQVDPWALAESGPADLGPTFALAQQFYCAFVSDFERDVEVVDLAYRGQIGRPTPPDRPRFLDTKRWSGHSVSQHSNTRAHATTADLARAIPPRAVAHLLSNTKLRTCLKFPPESKQKQGNTPSTASASSAVPTRAPSKTKCGTEPLGLWRKPTDAQSLRLRCSIGCPFRSP